MTNPTHTNSPAASDPDAKLGAVDDRVIKFLLSEDSLFGFWFGETPAGEKPFWWRKHLRAKYAIPQRSPEAIAGAVVDLVSPLLDSTFGAPDWAIQVAHAAMYWNDPNARLAASPAANVPAPEGVDWRKRHTAGCELLSNPKGWCNCMGPEDAFSATVEADAAASTAERARTQAEPAESSAVSGGDQVTEDDVEYSTLRAAYEATRKYLRNEAEPLKAKAARIELDNAIDDVMHVDGGYWEVVADRARPAAPAIPEPSVTFARADPVEDIPVTSEEVTRIRNSCVGYDSVSISSHMLSLLCDGIRMLRSSNERLTAAPTSPARAVDDARDSARLDYMIQSGDHFGHDRDGENCWLMYMDDDGYTHQRGVFDSGREAIDAAMKALAPSTARAEQE